MTYSIVARDPRTGELGVAVQSHFFGVGRVVTWGESGVGVVATQAFVDVSYGPLGLELMRRGRSATQALDALLAVDPDRDQRQVAMCDARGDVAVHTGVFCIEAAGHRRGDGVSAQANLMDRPTVWDAMIAAYESSQASDLAGRLLDALDAAEREGGDIRGRQSAAILIVGGSRIGRPWDDKLFDLRVEDHPAPLVELRRLVDLKRAYDRMDEAERALFGGGGVPQAAAEYAAVQQTLGAQNPEATFWAGIALAGAGNIEGARAALAPAFAVHDGWRRLVARLPAARLLPDEPGLVEELLREE